MIEDPVAVYRMARASYASRAPFHPRAAPVESLFPESDPGGGNEVYESVRQLMRLAGYDAERFGTAAWNPLGGIVQPGQFVLLKPNLVKEFHPRDPEGWRYVLTHGSVIRAVADYVWKALEGRGRVMLADAPQTDSSFVKIVEILGLDRLRDFYRSKGLDLELVDLRKEEWRSVDDAIVERQTLAGDPEGYVAFDLGDRSEFSGHKGAGRYYGADYDDGEVNRHHTGGRHEYLISGSAIHCDVFINIPKLKTHKKTGITVNLKNLVGINGDKNWLPHHTVGSPASGGDQFPEMTLRRRIEHNGAQVLRRIALRVPHLGPWLMRRARRVGTGMFGETSRVVRSGNWWGNDTTWRMCLDLNKLALYGNPDGTFRDPVPAGCKTYLSFVDGIIAGEGAGPMDPDPVEAGVLMLGRNPASVDAVAAVLMGFDPERLPLVRQSFAARGFPIASGSWRAVRCLSNRRDWSGSLDEVAARGELMRFKPHFGWTGRVEAAIR